VDVLLFNLEIAALSAVLVALFSLRGRFGLGPLFVALGVILGFMAVDGRLGIQAPVLVAGEGRYGSLVNLSLLLTGVVLVYALEGTSQARRLIAGLVLGSIMLHLLREVLAAHLLADGVDTALNGRARWLDPPRYGSFISTLALALDGVVILVVYQGLHNATRRMPVVVSFSLALVAGMVCDAVVFGGFRARLDFEAFAGQFVGKLTAGVAAAIPAALYISAQFRRHPELVGERGLLRRSAFEIVTLKRQLSSMQTALSQTRAEVEHVRQVFGRYVAPDVVDEILSDTTKLKLGGELREVTIVFSDIRGYSTLSENMGPEDTIHLLNEYFAAMSEVLNHFRGTIIEFEGDAILAIFNAPLDQPDHAVRAVKASLMMLEVVDELNRGWDADGTSRHWRAVNIPSFKIRIGVHTGQVVVGNVGSHSHTKYAVIGDAVNTAARVESLNKPLKQSLLISHATVEQLGPLAERLRLEDLGSHQVKGRREPVQVYTVAGHRSGADGAS
jgi:class 3 adenylate cyclase